MIYSNILQTIGNTPIVKINKLNPYKNVEIYAKIEGVNPGGSIKDRIALTMIKQAEQTGELTKDKTILESSSGNTGIGLAMVGAVMGYRVEIILGKSVTIERKKMLKAFGAKLIEVESSSNSKIRDRSPIIAQKIFDLNPNKYWYVNQYKNKHNPNTHFFNTAEEIIKDVPDLEYFVVSIGTSGTMVGVGNRLKKYNPKVKVIGVFPEKRHKIQGIKNYTEEIVPYIYDDSILDKRIIVNTSESYKYARLLARKEGIFVGMSSGAAMAGVLKLAKEVKSGKIVTIFPDRGEKYLSTELFD